jgi:nucleoside-diphosphate-sugar epimerase
LSRFDLEWKLADATNGEQLSKALAGCECVVHSVVGDPRVIEASAAALVPAAARAGVRRVVHLSSASVHGQNPSPGSNEDSPLGDHQELEYNNAKVRAERILLRSAQQHRVELVILRPSIVFGPRDRWITTLVHEMEAGTAWLINEGRGICNTIFIDNLVHAISRSLTAPASVAGQCFLVGDAETMTWRDLYQRTAGALGIDSSSIHQIESPAVPRRTWLDRVEGIRIRPRVQKMIARIPGKLKDAAKGALRGVTPVPTPNPWQFPPEKAPNPTREMILLQQCSYKLPDDKARRLLEYEPIVSFDEGLHRTLEWISWTRS